MKKLVLSIGVVVATTFAVFSQRPSNAIRFDCDFNGSGRFIKNIKAYNLNLSLKQADTIKVNTLPTNVVSDCFFADSIIIDVDFGMLAMTSAFFGISAYSGGNCATHSGDTVPLIPEAIVPLFMMLTSLKKMSDGGTKNKHHGIKAINTFKKRRI